MKDPRNLDAWVRAAFWAPTIQDGTKRLFHAEEQGISECRAPFILVKLPLISSMIAGRKLLLQDFGPDCLTKGPDEGGLVGQFWAVPETRPYMRVLHGLVDIHRIARKYSEAV